MTDQPTVSRGEARSRRALLAAAAGSAAMLAAQAVVAPATVLAHDPEDVQKEVDNPTATATSITNSTAVTPQAAQVAFVGASTGDGTGVHGFSGGTGSVPDEALPGTGVFGSALGVDGVGVTGFADDTPALSSIGVFGSGDNGVIGIGTFGVVGIGHAGVQGLTTAGDTGAAALFGSVADPGQYALRAAGKVFFSRSGRLLLAAGKTSVKVTLPQVTSATHVFAQIGSLRPGFHIESVVPAPGSFTIRLNKTLVQGAYIHWMVLDV